MREMQDPGWGYDSPMLRSLALFLAWAAVGFVASFALLYGFTPVGPLIVLIVLLAYGFLPRIAGSRLPEAFGAVTGFGAFWIFVSATVDSEAGWFAAIGLVAVSASVLSYLVAGRNRCGRNTATG